MNTSEDSYPAGSLPLPEIAVALREVTEYLANEVVAPRDEPPIWSEFQWRIAQAVAAMQGISSLLHGTLKWRGPVHWHRFLQEQRDHVAGRYSRIDQLIHAIDARARAAGVVLVALKGAALIKREIYAPGDRPMADIDLLVRSEDMEAVTPLLEHQGFDLTFTTWRHYLYEERSAVGAVLSSLGENASNPIKIELHTHVQERLPITVVDITERVFPDSPLPGLNSYPSIAALMLHLLLHATGNMRAHALRQIQLHDIALLAQRFSVADWEELLSMRPSAAALWWAFPPLCLTARYYPDAIPQFVVARVAGMCPWWLRRYIRGCTLADVSWCNLRVYAMPGIAWARSPLEAIRFIFARLWPSSDSRAELTRFAARHPGASEIPWYGISHARRILRWVFTRPPRVQAILPVRVALAQKYDVSAK